MSRKKTTPAMIGYDLGSSYSQISLCRADTKEPETISATMGMEQYNIPTALCKRKGVNQWFYGKEALKYAQREDGVLVESLYDLAMTGEEVMVDGENFDPIALLTLFVKRSLSLLTVEVNTEKPDTILFTVENLTQRTVEVLSAVAAGLNLSPGHIFFQGYQESLYQYVIHQPQELWKHQVLVFDYSKDLRAYILECNRKTTPIVVFVEKQEIPLLTKPDDWSEENRKEQDGRFLMMAKQLCGDRQISSVYLLGDGLKGDWAEETIRFLCAGRRVFQGNNMYSKGAAYGAREKKHPTELTASFVFLGEDKLKANVGMQVLRQGADSYFAVLDAGVNWYEAQSRYEVILDEGKQLVFLITSLTGGIVTKQAFDLEGLPERPPRTTRLSVRLNMISAEWAKVTVTDMGFGELFPASGKKWMREFSVSE